MTRIFKFASILGAALFLVAGSANAIPVPAGTLTLMPDYNPIVSLTNGTLQLVDYSDPTFNSFGFGGGTGQFLRASTHRSPVSAEGTTSSSILSFGLTVGSVVSYTSTASVDQLFVFTDASNGITYDFDLDQSITTLSNATTGQGTNLSLYLLGDLTGTGYTDPTPTAITLSMTITGASNVSISGTLSNPPPGTGLTAAPEPASMTLLGGGLAALGLIRRRRARK